MDQVQKVTAPPDGLQVLVLNKDMSPLATVNWKQAVTRLFKEVSCIDCIGSTCLFCGGNGFHPSAILVEIYEQYTIRSGGGQEFFVPSVIANREYVKIRKRRVPFSRTNVYKRDNYTCQYCGKKRHPSELELEHVIPRCMWNGSNSPTNWNNIVTTCLQCNRKKNNKTPEQAGMSLFRIINNKKVYYKNPKQPNYQDFVLGVSPYDLRIPKEWKPYILSLISKKDHHLFLTS